MVVNKALSYGFVGSWLLAVVMAFWWFEYRHWRAFADKTVVFSVQHVADLYHRVSTAQGVPLVVHFHNKSCPCNRYQEAHIDRIQPAMDGFRQLSIESSREWHDLDVPAVPAVAIWDEQGDMAYFGPYSSGSFCGQGTDFVTLVVDAMREQRSPGWVNTIGIGCYCEWQEV